jgi:hypothetical protein
MNHVVASKCSRNHFISDKSKTVLFKLHFLQNSPLVQFCKNLFSFSVTFLITSVASQKRRPFNVDFSQRNRWNQLEPGQDYCRHIFLCIEILNQNRPVCWSIVVKEKPTVVSPFFGAFPSNCIPKATEDVNLPFFTHSRYKKIKKLLYWGISKGRNATTKLMKLTYCQTLRTVNVPVWTLQKDGSWLNDSRHCRWTMWRKMRVQKVEQADCTNIATLCDSTPSRTQGNKSSIKKQTVLSQHLARWTWWW